MLKQILLSLFAFLSVGAAGKLFGATIDSWNNTALNVNASVNSIGASGAISRSPNLTYASRTSYFSSTNWEATNSEATAVTNGKYVQLTMNTTGYTQIHLIISDLKNVSLGPNNAQVYYSTNGGASFTSLA